MLEHRRSSAVLTILDKDSKPLANADINAELKVHEFLFGCNAFDTLLYLRPDNEEMRSFFEDRTNKWLDVFNFATLPFYWGNFEPEEGKPGTDALLEAAGFLKDRGVMLKGHPLCWHTVCAEWLLKYDDETIMDKQLARIDREVSNFKGLIDMWDVINETVIMPVFDKYDNAVTRICNRYGRIELIKKVFDEAFMNNEGATLLINDFNTSKSYEDVISECLDRGCKISAIGIQSHQHQGYWGKEKLLDVLDRFSKFDLPIHFTENTLLSGTPVPEYIEDLNDWQVEEWPSLPEYEKIQADQMEEIYRILFSDPNVKAITNWDFADGAWLNAPSGVVRKDNSLKPSYEMLRRLIKEEWTTKETLKTDENGNVKIEGFKGEYVIKYSGREAAFTLNDGCDRAIITI
ncbi:MAG: endo-1,4-beta-xylanase [Saccharofermentans sp.]|nr:endo-1,4-beta-xylanase [Saccharofermentans sp.]